MQIPPAKQPRGVALLLALIAVAIAATLAYSLLAGQSTRVAQSADKVVARLGIEDMQTAIGR